MNEEKKYLADFNKWLKETDPATASELVSISNDEKEIKERFIGMLSFGTAGLRGIMKAGTNAMNIYTVRHATQGFAEYIKENYEKPSVVISYDCRINSELFAREAACVMAANGIKVYFFGELRPTPVLSFSVRELGCSAGINITASHNPKEYNGYKAYGSDGSQLSPEAASAVSAKIDACEFFREKTCGFSAAEKSGLIEVLGTDFDERYMEKVLEQQTYPGLIASADDFSMVYSPLHGTGYRIVPEVLKRIGVKQLYTVDEQMVLDGNFPTVKFPNPEYEEVFGIGIEKANEVGADIIVATDPDADRVGVCARRSDGSFKTLTGNQVGALLLEYILTAYEEQGSMPEKPYAIKSIVSSSLADAVCRAHGVTVHNVFTGFKFIGEEITRHEEAKDGSFILGFEESYGYLKGTYARDKDAVVATMLIAEMAAYFDKQKKTLWDAMLSIYEKYGCYLEETESVVMTGLDGAERMKALMCSLRSEPPKSFGPDAVTAVRDYKAQTVTDTATGEKRPTGLTSSDVLYYETVSGDSVVVRPSGTEPKIKIYYLLHSEDIDSAKQKLSEYKASVKKIVEA